MNAKKPSRNELLSSCEAIGPEDGIDPHTTFRPPRPHVKNRKALQLCAQIAETLNFVLAWDSADEVLRDLSVVTAVPAPNAGHVLVTVATVAEDVPDALILERLQAAQGRLRTELATAIHRKRVPLLSFYVQRDAQGR